MNPARIRRFNDHEYSGGPVLYWMGREHRVQDNWSLLAARDMAREHGVPLVVVFTLVPVYLGATIRQYGFMLRGLQDVEQSLRNLDIPFYLLMGDPEALLLDHVTLWGIGAVFADFLPLRMPRLWKTRVAGQVGVPMFEVDAHNVVPAWEASPKQEAGAYTIRHKLRKLWPAYLEEFPAAQRQAAPWPHARAPIDWDAARASAPGQSRRGRSRLDRRRRDRRARRHGGFPHAALSRLRRAAKHSRPARAIRTVPIPAFRPPRPAAPSPWKSRKATGPTRTRPRFSTSCSCAANSRTTTVFTTTATIPWTAPLDWPRKTLDDHRSDPRPFLYTRDQLENAQTHDDLWNAAQREMGGSRQDARLPAHVLVQEDPGVDGDPGRRPGLHHPSQ